VLRLFSSERTHLKNHCECEERLTFMNTKRSGFGSAPFAFWN
jgi:hypothetical protein